MCAGRTYIAGADIKDVPKLGITPRGGTALFDAVGRTIHEVADRHQKAAEDEKPAEFKYMSFDIISPANKQTIRDDPDVTVSLKLKPGLNMEENHSIWMLVDGKPVVKNTQSLTIQLGRLDRGAHQLQAQIRNNEGAIIVRTRPTVVFIHKTSAH